MTPERAAELVAYTRSVWPTLAVDDMTTEVWMRLFERQSEAVVWPALERLAKTERYLGVAVFQEACRMEFHLRQLEAGPLSLKEGSQPREVGKAGVAKCREKLRSDK